MTVMNVVKTNWPKQIPTQLTYRNGAKPLHEYLEDLAISKPNRTAFHFYGKAITWNELNEDTKRLAQYLKNNGVGKGDRVGLFMQNCPQYIIGHYAIQKIGGIVVPLNPMYKEAELEYFTNEVEIKGMIASQELYSRLESITPKTPSIEFVVTTNYSDYALEVSPFGAPEELTLKKETFPNSDDFLEVIKSTPPLTETATIDIWEDIGLMTFTSGTTGRPKAAMLSYGNALFKTAATVSCNEISEKDRNLAVAPLFHIAGMVMGVNIPIYSGSECVLLTRFDPGAVINVIESYKINIWYSIAPMNVAILQYPGVENRDLSSLEKNMATSFGIPVSGKLAESWSALTNGCTLAEAAYGLSETHTCDTFMPHQQIKYGSCGIPTYETEIRIVDLELGKDLAPLEEGEIVIKNPGVFKGYWNLPDATAEMLRDGWVYTGDIGVIDADGYLHFKGRVKEMIKCSGFSVFPEDVEALMNDHPAILQSAAIGVPDEIRGESVKAFIVLSPEYKGRVTETELIAWAEKHMSAYKYPRFIEFRDSLPATGAGKVLRRLLKEEHEKSITT